MNITDVTPKIGVLTAGLAFTMVVNFSAPFTVKRFESRGLAYDSETVHIKTHHFDVGSLSGGVQWMQIGPVLLPLV